MSSCDSPSNQSTSTSANSSLDDFELHIEVMTRARSLPATFNNDSLIEGEDFVALLAAANTPSYQHFANNANRTNIAQRGELLHPASAETSDPSTSPTFRQIVDDMRKEAKPFERGSTLISSSPLAQIYCSPSLQAQTSQVAATTAQFWPQASSAILKRRERSQSDHGIKKEAPGAPYPILVNDSQQLATHSATPVISQKNSQAGGPLPVSRTASADSTSQPWPRFVLELRRGRGRPRATGPAPTRNAAYMREYRERQRPSCPFVTTPLRAVRSLRESAGRVVCRRIRTSRNIPKLGLSKELEEVIERNYRDWRRI